MELAPVAFLTIPVAIAGLVIAIVLLVVGVWLARDLTAASKMQDCVMSGRTNCNVIEPAR